MIGVEEVKSGRIVYSPGGLRCIIHSGPCNIYDDVIYQVEDDVWPDEGEGESERLRTMDAYTF